MVDKSKKPSAEIITPGLGEIEKVRDILFGKHVTSFEQRFADLEARLEADVEQLKQRLSDKIDSMDKSVNQALEGLDEKIASEQRSRDSDLSDLQQSLVKAEAALSSSISIMEDQANQDMQAVRKSLQTGHQELLDQSAALQAELVAQIEAQKQELEGDKVGRQALALLLDEVAIKLRGN